MKVLFKTLCLILLCSSTIFAALPNCLIRHCAKCKLVTVGGKKIESCHQCVKALPKEIDPKKQPGVFGCVPFKNFLKDANCYLYSPNVAGKAASCNSCYELANLGQVSSNPTLCQYCDTQKMVFTAKKCVQRVEKFENCMKLSPRLETCTECKKGYIKNSATKKCIKFKDTKCNYASSATVCTSCMNGYALVNSKCVSSGVANCQVGSKQADNTVKCTRCSQGYYMKTTDSKVSCIKIAIKMCAIVNNPTAEPKSHTCKSCIADTVNQTAGILTSGKCMYINGCQIYTSGTECSQCDYKHGYYATGVTKNGGQKCSLQSMISGIFVLSFFAILAF